MAPTVTLITLRPGDVHAAGLEAEQHVADGGILRIVQATVTHQPGFQIASVLYYRSWINLRQRHRLKQCFGSHQAQYDIGVQSACYGKAVSSGLGRRRALRSRSSWPAAGLPAHTCRGRPRVCRPRGARAGLGPGLGVGTRQERAGASAGTWKERAYARSGTRRAHGLLGGIERRVIVEPDCRTGGRTGGYVRSGSREVSFP